MFAAAASRLPRDIFLERSISALKTAHPEFSAEKTITRGQGAILLALPLVTIALFCIAPALIGALVTISFVLAFLANGIFRALLVWVGAGEAPKPAPPAKGALPRYTILVPLYREANVLPALVEAMRALDYPKKKLDIKLILEADDTETIAAAAALDLEECFEIIRVPPASPRTKPKACNYALNFARGKYLVIYDAEDRPEPDQLKKAVAAFRAARPEIACLQARLNFYNANEIFLTAMFALDYALWFDFLLPGLDRLNVPMPLGGTSNHFRTRALRAIHGWDPYNVTEDADLGIRLAQMGYRVATLDSTTFEEATTDLPNWLRQRSRWLKGYMQTWLVHMRSPRGLLRNAGFRGFLCFQLFVGGTILTALLSPILWALSLLPLVPGFPPLPDFGIHFPVPALSLFIGNALFTYLAMLGPYRRGWLSLTPYGLAAPIYWLLISLAGYRGLVQLFTKPWHWEKTRHGTSKMLGP
jgi:cellulose synthase/poly-beta-1,6-N-acetylglucosamine synthase-like glycosyltransferase